MVVRLGSSARDGGADLLALTVMLLVALAGSAGSAEASEQQPPATTPPDLSVVSAAPVAVELVDTDQIDDSATLDFVVINKGSTASSPLTFAVWLDRELQEGCVQEAIKITPELTPRGLTVQGNDSLAVTLQLAVPRSCAGQSGTLVVDPGSATPATARLSLVRDPIASVFWWPIGWAFGSALLLGAFLFTRRRGRLRVSVGPESAWSFKDSWLTNVSALGGILGTVLAATGLLEELLPGVPSTRYVGVGLLFTGIIVTAPIVYAISTKWSFDDSQPPKLNPTGRVWGVIVATAMVVCGVTGQLVTLIVITLQAEADQTSKIVVTVCLVLGCIFAWFYGLVFAFGVTEQPPVAKTEQKRFRDWLQHLLGDREPASDTDDAVQPTRGISATP